MRDYDAPASAVDRDPLPLIGLAFEHAAGARQGAGHGSREGCDCRCRGVVGQGAQRGAAASGRGADPAALSGPEGGGGSRLERAAPRTCLPQSSSAAPPRRSAAPTLPPPAAGRGDPWSRGPAGLAIYTGTHASLLPALGVQRPPWRLAPAAVVWDSMSHAVFGTALEAHAKRNERLDGQLRDRFPVGVRLGAGCAS